MCTIGLFTIIMVPRNRCYGQCYCQQIALERGPNRKGQPMTPIVVEPRYRGKGRECRNWLGRQLLLFRRLLSFVVELFPFMMRGKGLFESKSKGA